MKSPYTFKITWLLIQLVFFLLLVVSFTAVSQKVEVAVQGHHIKGPKDAMFSHDDKLFFTIGDDNTCKVWDVKTGLLIKTVSMPGNDVSQLTVSSDNNYALVSGYGSGYYLDLKKGVMLKKVRADLYNSVLLPDGKRYIEGSALTCRDLSTDAVVWTKGRSWDHYRLKVSRDGKYFVSKTFGADEIELYSSENGDLVRTLKAPKDKPGGLSMNDMNFNASGDKLFALHNTGQLIIYDVASGKKLFDGNAGKKITGVRACFTGDDMILLSSGKFVYHFDWKNKKIIKEFGPHLGGAVIASAQKQPLFISTSRYWEQSELYLWNYQTGVKVKSLGKNVAGLKEVEFSKDGKLIGGRTNTPFMIDKTNQWKIKKVAKTDDLFPDFDLKSQLKNYAGVGDKTIDAAARNDNWTALGLYMQVNLYKYSSLAHEIKDATEYVINNMAFDPKGNLLVSSGYIETVVYNPNTRSKIAELEDAFVFDFSNDGKYLVTDNRNKVALREPFPPYKIIKLFDAHSTKVTSVSFGGDILLSAADDGVIKLWKVPSCEPIASIFVLDQERRLIVTPDGYYMADKNITSQEIAFSIGEHTYPFEQFDLKFNRPDIVLERLGGSSPELIAAYKKAYQKRLKKMGFKEEMLAEGFHIPEITLSGQPPVSTPTKSIQFKINAKDEVYPIERVNVYVNNVPVYGITGLKVTPSRQFEKEITVELTNGLNVIQVSVMNDHAGESLKETFNVNYEGPAIKPALYVIAIGVSEFKDSNYNLTYAAKDAKDIASLYTSETGKSKYSQVHTFTFLDAAAIKTNIIQIKENLKGSKVDDEVVVFVASHGLLDNDLNYYIATHDVNFDSPAGAGLLYEDLESLLDGIPARRKWMLLDACHSGEVDKEESELVASSESYKSGVKSRGFKSVVKKENNLGLNNSFELMQELFADLRKGTGAIVISSASGTEFAFESSEWKNGVFTYSLLEGLKTGNSDSDKNGKVQISELKNYVIKRVVELTNGKQHPTSRMENLENDFVVW